MGFGKKIDTICVPKFALACSFVEAPFTLILCTICPLLHAWALAAKDPAAAVATVGSEVAVSAAIILQ